MTVRTRAELNSDADAALADNTTGDISPSDVRTRVKDLADSSVFKLDSPVAIGVACSDETTPITTGTAKVTFRSPKALTVTDVRASLSTAQTSGSIVTVDINVGGTSILSTKLTIDNGEKTSATAATAAVISSASIAADGEITIDIDQVGDGTACGLKVWLVGYWT